MLLNHCTHLVSIAHRLDNPNGIYTSQSESDNDIEELANMANVPRVALGFIACDESWFIGQFTASFSLNGNNFSQNFMTPTWTQNGYSVSDVWIRNEFNMLANSITLVANVQSIEWAIFVEDQGTC